MPRVTRLVFFRLLDHRGLARVPGAAELVGGRRGGGVPQLLGVRGHARLRGAARAARQVQDVGAGDGRAVVDRRGDRGREEDGGERRAARVGGQAALGLEAVDEVALRAVQALVVRHGQHGHDVEAVLVDVAQAAGHRAAVDVAAAVLRHVGEAADGQAGVVLAQDEVDDAADGVGAVGRRGAVLEHLDALDGGHRDLVQVDDAAVEAVCRDAASVQQDQRRVGALQAQVGGGRAVVAAGLARDHVRVGGQVVQAVPVGGEGGDQLLGRHDALAVQVAAGDGLHR